MSRSTVEQTLRSAPGPVEMQGVLLSPPLESVLDELAGGGTDELGITTISAALGGRISTLGDLSGSVLLDTKIDRVPSKCMVCGHLLGVSWIPDPAVRTVPAVDILKNVLALNDRQGVDPAGLMALVGAGMIAAHELGYVLGLLTGSDATFVPHTHLAVFGPVALVALCIAGWAAAVRVLRAGGGSPPSWHRLALLQVGAYLVLEVGERVVIGDLVSLFSAPVLFGLLLQPIIAWMAVRLLAASAGVLVRIFGAVAPRPVVAPLAVVAPMATPLRSVWAPGRFRLRGPPMV